MFPNTEANTYPHIRRQEDNPRRRPQATMHHLGMWMTQYQWPRRVH